MKECDLIMKGGITSGVVYPFAISELAKQYRLRNIGGTSAGAIGAVFAAAAEYRRQSDKSMAGFEEIESVAEEIGCILQDLFQPTPSLQPLYAVLMANLEAKTRMGKLLAMIRAALTACLTEVMIAGAIGAIILFSAFLLGNVALGILGFLLFILIAACLILMRFYRLIIKELPANDFGICSGKTVSGKGSPGFSDWIANRIDTIAGLYKKGAPPTGLLTVGALREKGIVISAMTTDLSSARPYRLPMQSSIHFFSRKEFEKLFPDYIVDYLCEKGGKSQYEVTDADVPKDLYKLPVGDDFPVLLVARMSLSFPGLIRAVPLWRVDYARRTDDGAPMQRCLFSDGGISSNFPIHFFDAMLPSRPTFGISLTSLEPHHKDERIDLPTKGRQSTSQPIRQVEGISGFLSAIFNTAKDWQDSMQSLLPGYAERIVSIRLDDSTEGGMHLNMDKDTVRKLTSYGQQAGQTLLTRFSFDQHRYNRAISILPALARELVTVHEIYEKGQPADGQEMSYPDILKHLEPSHYENSAEWREQNLDRFAQDLSSLGAKPYTINLKAAISDADIAAIPSSDSKIRLVALADRVPRPPRN
ncbi:patatin-like phospholipase family protein [uncultured Cohaesibacter sp.]|uniref:patatin-like phospholipase family protein n=1 Tax=uncultured Cohaesibacter sp. TaxID=1002546 RepID=UPI0029C717C1|nr:patatin-like phospholipase family protein [uncultured Cohaesibacter sp.]